MEVLNFKLPASGASGIRLHSTPPRSSFPRERDNSAFAESMFAPVAGGSGALKRQHRAHFKFLEALQNYRATRHGYRVFVRALEREKVRAFTVK